MSIHANASGLDLHEDKRVKAPARVSSTANVTLSAPGATIDGVTMASGNRILLTEQSVLTENGIYVWNGAASPLSRSSDATSDSDFPLGFLTFVSEGTLRGQTLWMFTTTTAVTVGSTSLTFETITATGPTGPTGSTGATGPIGPSGSSTNLITVTGATPYICLQDQKAQNVASGTFTSGAWRTRTLNTTVADRYGLATLVSNQVTLPAGTYRVHAICQVNAVSACQARLQNVTDATTMVSGLANFTSSGHSLFIAGRFSLQSTKTLELQNQCSVTRNSDGFGAAGNFGPEVYAVLEFWLEDGPPPFLGRTFENPNLDKLRERRYQSSVDEVGQGSNAILPV